MINYTLILLNDSRNIFVSDEEIKERDWVKHLESNNLKQIKKVELNTKDNPDTIKLFNEGLSAWFELVGGGLGNTKSCKKIIAGIEPLPTLTYSDEVKQILRDKYGWVDWINEWESLNNKLQNVGGVNPYAFEKGFKAHQSITNKMFSLEDMKIAFISGGSLTMQNYFGKNNLLEDEFKNTIQSLQQPIQLNVEIETEPYTVGEMSKLPLGTINQKPKITNNSILITKILE